MTYWIVVSMILVAILAVSLAAWSDRATPNADAGENPTAVEEPANDADN